MIAFAVVVLGERKKNENETQAIIGSLNKAKEKANNEGEKLADISHTTSFSFCHVSSPLES